jgi:hypothetical protein
MQAGLVARVNGSFEEIRDEEFPIEKEDGLKASLRVRDRMKNQSGDKILDGIAAEEIRTEDTTSEIAPDGSIKEVTSTQIGTKSSKFATISDTCIVIENSSSDFIFNLIEKNTQSLVTPIEFDLDQMASDYVDSGSGTWMAGFYDYDGNANTGVAYGGDVYKDKDLQPMVTGGKLNQLGLVIEQGPEELKVMITKSGYIRIYSPSDYGTPSFMRLVKELINKYGLDSDKR